MKTLMLCFIKKPELRGLNIIKRPEFGLEEAGLFHVFEKRKSASFLIKPQINKAASKSLNKASKPQ